jgi:DNA gyrase subunit B
MTDADVDGAHIRTLLLTLFFRYFNGLITNGNLYIAQPPLYSVKKGKVTKWVYSPEELEKVLGEMKQLKVEDTPKKIKETDEEPAEEIPEENPEVEVVELKDESLKGITVQRYKGLGEMNPDQLWDTTMAPATRVLKRVTIEDAAKADEIFDVLMGSDVIPRKKFIQTHAKKVKNLDI